MRPAVNCEITYFKISHATITMKTPNVRAADHWHPHYWLRWQLRKLPERIPITFPRR